MTPPKLIVADHETHARVIDVTSAEREVEPCNAAVRRDHGSSDTVLANGYDDACRSQPALGRG